MSDTALLQPLTQARSQIALWQQRAAAAAVTLRQPPTLHAARRLTEA
ncbi:hypothetical protein [Comamonas thiooxydans]|nr:hypothetical protein [Comamonas thiooxydans]UUE95970.1 hypothetical protein MJ608_10235 [Comamonas thiooxydans]